MNVFGPPECSIFAYMAMDVGVQLLSSDQTCPIGIICHTARSLIDASCVWGAIMVSKCQELICGFIMWTHGPRRGPDPGPSGKSVIVCSADVRCVKTLGVGKSLQKMWNQLLEVLKDGCGDPQIVRPLFFFPSCNLIIFTFWNRPLFKNYLFLNAWHAVLFKRCLGEC